MRNFGTPFFLKIKNLEVFRSGANFLPSADPLGKSRLILSRNELFASVCLVVRFKIGFWTQLSQNLGKRISEAIEYISDAQRYCELMLVP